MLMQRHGDAATIGDLFAATVGRFPEREALVFREQRWSYRELGRLVSGAANRLAHLLPDAGARVALVGGNHPAYVVGYFAAQVLGASTAEVGRDESLATVLDTVNVACPSVVLTDRRDLVEALRGRVAVQDFGGFLSSCADMAEPGVRARARPGDDTSEACIVFTSGTTGLPKGVVLSHRNVLFVVDAVCRYLAIQPEDRYALVLPLSHTYGKSNLLTAVAAGATSVIVERFEDLPGFFEQLHRGRCTLLSVVPFHLNVLARRGLPPGDGLPALRAITTSGGELSWETARAVTRLLPRTRLFAMYGLTEAATRVSYLDPELLMVKRGSVGRPLPGVQVEIHGEDGRRVVDGATGEIAVQGPNVMRRYLADDDLTRTSIVDGWLLTGDLGHLDQDGFLYIEGRTKEILKVAGERISPAEIEHTLASHPAIADAAVVGAPDALLGEVAWAYVVLRPGAPGIGDLSRHCAARLSPHKIPRRVVVVDHIPRTPTGKIRRRLLGER